tara:strand:+ start:225 stop:1088 length:864 start_codon:yes stop_codon:yes gene_type:complete
MYNKPLRETMNNNLSDDTIDLTNGDDDEETSWDEVVIEKTNKNVICKNEPIIMNTSGKNIDNDTHGKTINILDDRRLFNNADNSNIHSANGIWQKNKDTSELLNNNIVNELEQQYASYWSEVKNENITEQTYDNIINLRNKESETYFTDAHDPNMDINELNKQRLTNLNTAATRNTSSESNNDSINSNNTLDYKSLGNTTIYDNAIIGEQYNTLKNASNVASFLKTETANVDIDKRDEEESPIQNIQKETIELSDVRTTYAFNSKSHLMKPQPTIEAFENFSNMSTI